MDRMPDHNANPTPESGPGPEAAESGRDAREAAWSPDRAGERAPELASADDALSRALAPDEASQPPADLVDRILAATTGAEASRRAASGVTESNATDDAWSARLDVALAADAADVQPSADLVDRIVGKTSGSPMRQAADPVIARVGPRLWAPLATLAAVIMLAVGAWFFSQAPAGLPAITSPQVAVQPPDPAAPVAPSAPSDATDAAGAVDPVLALEQELARYQPPDASFDRDVALLHAELTDLRTWPQATWAENSDDDPWSDLTLGSAPDLF